MDIVIITEIVTSLNVFGMDTIAMMFNQFRLISLINALVITKGIVFNVKFPRLSTTQDGPGRTLRFDSDDRPLSQKTVHFHWTVHFKDRSLWLIEAPLRFDPDRLKPIKV